MYCSNVQVNPRGSQKVHIRGHETNPGNKKRPKTDKTQQKIPQKNTHKHTQAIRTSDVNGVNLGA